MNNSPIALHIRTKALGATALQALLMFCCLLGGSVFH